jgi:hypothetical protein
MRIPFAYLHHLVTVPVAVDGLESTFVLDSGIGLTLVSQEFGEAAGCRKTGGSFSGRRMSGQEVTVPLGTARSLVFGSRSLENVEVGVLDMSGFPRELAGVGGFLSLASFADVPVIVDYPESAIVLENAESLAARRAAGTPVDVRLERDGPSLTVFCPLTLPDGRSVAVEVDMGSDALILDHRFAAELGVDLDGGDMRRVDGVDETGHAYTRWFGRLDGAVWVTGAPELAQHAPEVQFQRIIHDGLVGAAFLRRFAVTFDLGAAQLIFG